MRRVCDRHNAAGGTDWCREVKSHATTGEFRTSQHLYGASDDHDDEIHDKDRKCEARDQLRNQSILRANLCRGATKL